MRLLGVNSILFIKIARITSQRTMYCPFLLADAKLAAIVTAHLTFLFGAKFLPERGIHCTFLATVLG